MLVFREAIDKDLPVRKELETLLEQLFAVMPNLEFHDSGHGRIRADDGVTKSYISRVNVYAGEQKLGVIQYNQKYNRNGYAWAYSITSRKILKQRGSNKHTKSTQDIKTALKIAKEVFVKDSDNLRVVKILNGFVQEYNSLVWHAQSKCREYLNVYAEKAFDYVVSVVENNPAVLDPKMLAALQSEQFKEKRDTYRIAKSVEQSLANKEGVIVYVDRENKISVADLQKETLSKIDSTYDLPKNYQEKYTILKVMDLNQPIENIGVKLTVEIDDVKSQYYYLSPGDTVVTH